MSWASTHHCWRTSNILGGGVELWQRGLLGCRTPRCIFSQPRLTCCWLSVPASGGSQSWSLQGPGLEPGSQVGLGAKVRWEVDTADGRLWIWTRKLSGGLGQGAHGGLINWEQEAPPCTCPAPSWLRLGPDPGQHLACFPKSQVTKSDTAKNPPAHNSPGFKPQSAAANLECLLARRSDSSGSQRAKYSFD